MSENTFDSIISNNKKQNLIRALNNNKMRKIMLLCCTGLLTGLSTMAQTVNDKTIKGLNSNFALITAVGINKDHNDVVVNFGREGKNNLRISDAVIKDDKGVKVVFQSTDEALQFMKQNGYEQIDNFIFKIGNKSITQYLLKKEMENNLKFKVGDGVTVTKGPMKRIYGTVIFFDEKTGKYLIRFGSAQQLYYTEDQLEVWKK
ncbi:hypothetical protein [Pedobacter antarcticus]|uniref:hypothetical protein n=1 Tax=Pedobacter antarcticus TaxID=34086 RepID=UPI0029306C27|nr:hypothetical protein [Pedobacter antarcticus]